MSLRVVRREFEGVAEEVGCEFPALLLEGEDAEVVVGAGVSRVQAERAEIEALRDWDVSGGELQVALREIDFRILRRIGVGEIKFAPGQRKILRLERLQSGVIGVESPERGVFLRQGDEGGAA